MESVSTGVAVLCLFAPMGISLLIWFLYNFHLESKRSAQSRKHTMALIHPGSLAPRSGVKMKSLVVVAMLTLISVSAVGQSASASRAPQSGQTDALQKKVEGLATFTAASYAASDSSNSSSSAEAQDAQAATP